jgi:hypothetical protein
MEPLISTSALRVFLEAEISAMVCLLVVLDCCFGGGVAAGAAGVELAFVSSPVGFEDRILLNTRET